MTNDEKIKFIEGLIDEAEKTLILAEIDYQVITSLALADNNKELLAKQTQALKNKEIINLKLRHLLEMLKSLKMKNLDN